MSSTQSTMIRIYPSFTEIREDLNSSSTASPHSIYIVQDLYNQIMSGTLNLEGEAIQVHAIDAVTRENNLEGKECHVSKDKQLRKVKMVRSRDSLVQDVETGRYFHADQSQIEFNEVPEETGTEVTFTFSTLTDKKTDEKIVLSYLMYGIKWTPRYTFNVCGDEGQLQGWADIANNTQKEFTIAQTELFGGDIDLQAPRQYMSMQPQMMMMSVATRAMPIQVESQGEVPGGLYMYTIGQRYVLKPHSTFSLPFVAPSVELKKVCVLQSHFSTSNKKGSASRVYKITCGEFLPGGDVIVREDGRVVGQAHVNDLSAHESADLRVGSDADVSYERSVKTVTHGEDVSTYDVSVSVRNKKKDRKVNYEYVEHFVGRWKATADDAAVVIENDYAKRVGELEANGGEQVFKFTVTFYYKD